MLINSNIRLFHLTAYQNFYFHAMKAIFLSLFIALLSVSSFAQDKIQWMTWNEAVEKNAVEQKVIFVDVYTDWCGWCKKMDATTFKNEKVVDYMNEHYYAVKFNAETHDTIRFNNQEFINESNTKKGPHQLAVALLDGRMSYPSYAFIGQPWDKTVAPGYMGAKDFQCVIKYFVEGAPQGQTFDQFKIEGCPVAAAD
jgi:thioredoxin-related protein